MAKKTASAMDMPAHRATYDLFTRLTFWSVIHIVVILVLMAIFLV